MQRIATISPLVRAIGVFMAVAVLVSSVTFAALSDSVTLTDSQINSATADLQIWDGSTWAETSTGFTVDDVVPGVPTMAATVYFKNNGGVPLELTAQIDDSDPMVFTGGITADDVTVTIKNYDENVMVEKTLQQLINNPHALPGDPLLAGEQGSSTNAQAGNYLFYVTIDPAAVSGQSASVSNIDMTFAGTQPTN